MSGFWQRIGAIQACSKWRADQPHGQNTKTADGSQQTRTTGQPKLVTEFAAELKCTVWGREPAHLQSHLMRRYPFSFVALTLLGILCAIPGIISLAGFGASLHPVLDDPMAGLAFIVSAIALIGSGAFPLVIAKLKADEKP